MQSKTALPTHNEILTVSEPWHRGSGFTWVLLALAGLVFFLSGAVAKAQSSWDTRINYGSGFQNASSASLGAVNSLNVTGAEFKAWSNPGPWWNDSLFVYRVTGQNLGGGWATAGLPRTGNNENDVFFGNSSLNINLLNGIDYRGTYTFEYKYEFKNNNGTHAPSGVFNPQFTVNNGNYYAQWNSDTGSQSQFNGGEATLQGERSLVKVGAGQINLTGNNSYTGNTTINAGALEVQHSNGLGTAAGKTTVADGAQLRFFTGGAGLSVAENIEIIGTGNGGAILSTGGNNSLTGTVTLTGNARVGANTTGGAGALSLGAVSGGSNVLYVGGSADISISGEVSGAGNTEGGTTTSLFKDGNNTLTLTGANSYSGDTRLEAGVLTVSGSGTLGNGNSDVFLRNGTTLNVNTSLTVDSIRETTNNAAGGVIAIGNGATLTVDGVNKGTLYQNNISGAGGLTVAGSGDTSLALYGTQSYTGATTVTGGKLTTAVALASTSLTVNGGTLETTADGVIANNASTTLSSGTFSIGGNDTIGSVTATGGRLSVGSGKTAYLTNGTSSIGANAEIVGGTLNVTSGSTLTLNSDDTDNSSAIAVASGGTLNGSGTTSGALTVDGILAPGNSPGTLDVGDTTFLGGGTYQWEINDWSGTQGANPGWDWLDVTGVLTFAKTGLDAISDTNRFTIDVVSLLSGGNLANFDATSTLSFVIATASGGIANYNDVSGFINLNTAGFLGGDYASKWSLGVVNGTGTAQSLQLTYTGATAIPEPSSASMLVLGLAAVLAKRRRAARG